MKENIPLVSIGLPVYNSAEYLNEVIDSLLNQSFRNFELIISDDASKDETANICKSYVQKDDRICFIAQKSNLGMVNNQNFVLNQSKGKYFMWAAHDDFYHKDYIQILVNELENDHKLVTAFCPVAYFTTNPEQVARVCRWNYSYKWSFVRIISLCLHFNDAMFYGIHRRSIITKTCVPIWWGKNSLTPANSNYPVVFYLLASGGYKLVGDIPLFYKREKEETYLLSPKNRGISPYWYLFSRKLNLFVYSLKYIYSASTSIILPLSLAVPLFLRIGKDMVFDSYYRLKCSILKRKM